MNRSIQYKPLYYFIAYISFTLLVSIFGPIEYVGYDVLPVVVYMIAFLLLFSIGYVWGSNTKIATRHASKNNAVGRLSAGTLVKQVIVITLLFKLVELASGVVSGTLDFSFSSMGTNYVDLYADYERNQGSYSVAFLLTIVSTLPLWLALTLGVYYFKRLPFQYKVYLLAIVFITLLVNTISQGKQKQLGDLIVFTVAVLAIKYGSNDLKLSKSLLRNIVILGLVATASFVFILKLRYEAVGIRAFSYNTAVSPLAQLDLDHFVFSIFGYDWGFPFAILLSYFAGGYYGLSLSLSLPFEWTYMAGSSYSVMVVTDKYLGGGFLLYETYPLRMEAATGWPGMSKWHTIFPWLAGDYTFIGSLFLFVPIARMYAICWKEATSRKNMVSITLFCILSLGLIYVPANNQLFIAPGSVIATLFLIFYWCRKHKNYN